MSKQHVSLLLATRAKLISEFPAWNTICSIIVDIGNTWDKEKSIFYWLFKPKFCMLAKEVTQSIRDGMGHNTSLEIWLTRKHNFPIDFYKSSEGRMQMLNLRLRYIDKLIEYWRDRV